MLKQVASILTVLLFSKPTTAFFEGLKGGFLSTACDAGGYETRPTVSGDRPNKWFQQFGAFCVPMSGHTGHSYLDLNLCLGNVEGTLTWANKGMAMETCTCLNKEPRRQWPAWLDCICFTGKNNGGLKANSVDLNEGLFAKDGVLGCWNNTGIEIVGPGYTGTHTELAGGF